MPDVRALDALVPVRREHGHGAPPRGRDAEVVSRHGAGAEGERGVNAPRHFVITGGRDPGDLVDRAAEHGAPVRAVAHPAPSGHVYGAVEVARPAPVRDVEAR